MLSDQVVMMNVILTCVLTPFKISNGGKLPLIGQIPRTPDKELDPSYWRNAALKTLEAKMRLKPNMNTAKNVILFLGDGMSFPTIAAARIFKGQLDGRPGEETRLIFEDFPGVGLSKTYCTDTSVSDSACSATAYLSGVKGAYFTLGVNGHVREDDCAGSLNESNRVHSIVKWAQDAGKSTGVITTTRITHASPAGAYAYSASREWEVDTKMPQDSECKDIAHQLIYNSPGKDIKVVMGGGLDSFIPEKRSDGENLIEKWKEGKIGQRAAFIQNRQELLNLDTLDIDYVLGLFTGDHLSFHVDADHEMEPSLAEMTEKSIEILRKDPKGFFLFVEGGKIDIAHHYNLAHKAMIETMEFEKAIEKAMSMTNEEDTMIVVTADHSHSFALNGYPKRGNSIFGFSDELSDVDFKPILTLSYMNGPTEQRYDEDNTRYNLNKDDTLDPQYHFQAMVTLGYETHGGDDIGVYARGPWSHLLIGQFDQNYIPVVMGHAANILPFTRTDGSSSSGIKGKVSSQKLANSGKGILTSQGQSMNSNEKSLAVRNTDYILLLILPVIFFKII